MRCGGAAGTRLQELDGDLAVELGVVGAVHDAHTAFAELLDDDVAADQGPSRKIFGLRFAAGALGMQMPLTLGGLSSGFTSAPIRFCRVCIRFGSLGHSPQMI